MKNVGVHVDENLKSESQITMGYHKLITYILNTEPGTSLRAAGWKCVGQAGGLRWTGKRRPEVDLCPAQMKLRWEIGDEAALNDLEADHESNSEP